MWKMFSSASFVLWGEGILTLQNQQFRCVQDGGVIAPCQWSQCDQTLANYSKR